MLGHILNERGIIEAGTAAVRIADDRSYLVCAAFFEWRVRNRNEREVRPDEGVAILNMSREHGAMVLQGPGARAAPGGSIPAARHAQK